MMLMRSEALVMLPTTGRELHPKTQMITTNTSVVGGNHTMSNGETPLIGLAVRSLHNGGS